MNEIQKLSDWVASDRAIGQIAAAVGETMPADQFIAHMLVAFEDEKVRPCSVASKSRALMECAALGLLPTLGQVALIPYGKDIKAMPQWQGYKAVMERHPAVLEVEAVLVHKSDQFSVGNNVVNHDYDPFDEKRTIDSVDDLRGGYCRITYLDGRRPRFHFVTKLKLKKAQACAQTQNIWKKWYYEMALKTLYRDCYARRAVPVDPLANARLETITRADDAVLGNDPSRVALPSPASPTLDALLSNTDIPTVGETEPEPKRPALEPVIQATAELVDQQVWEFEEAYANAKDHEAIDRLWALVEVDTILQTSPEAVARCSEAATAARKRVSNG